jgi:hypothetical protein
VRGPGLHVAPDGRFVAVVMNYGRYGSLLDRRAGAVVRQLDRGEYQPDTQPFPIAFIDRGGATVLIAGTDWNRLDAFAADTGDCLTERGIEGRNSEHYLDYFHGGLLPSPSGRWLLDDGWVWHPIGVPMITDLRRWLDSDRYASEHPLGLTQRAYAWNQPAAWIDENTVAVQRIGLDDEAMIEGVQIFDAEAGTRVRVFAGPAGPMWGYRGLLYVDAAAGLEVWDPELRARIGTHSGFHPIAHNPRTDAFAELADGRLRIWTPRPVVRKFDHLHPDG